jgi:hypothetical protein
LGGDIDIDDEESKEDMGGHGGWGNGEDYVEKVKR